MVSGSHRSSDRLRIGVTGAGFVAQVVHLPHLADAVARFEIAALAEPDAGVRAAVARRHGVEAFATQDEMLASARLDAVLIASPNATHADAAIEALEAGCHVLVEKPLCL